MHIFHQFMEVRCTLFLDQGADVARRRYVALEYGTLFNCSGHIDTKLGWVCSDGGFHGRRPEHIATEATRSACSAPSQPASIHRGRAHIWGPVAAWGCSCNYICKAAQDAAAPHLSVRQRLSRSAVFHLHGIVRRRWPALTAAVLPWLPQGLCRAVAWQLQQKVPDLQACARVTWLCLYNLTTLWVQLLPWLIVLVEISRRFQSSATSTYAARLAVCLYPISPVASCASAAFAAAVDATLPITVTCTDSPGFDGHWLITHTKLVA